jgi:hypothetical protein
MRFTAPSILQKSSIVNSITPLPEMIPISSHIKRKVMALLAGSCGSSSDGNLSGGGAEKAAYLGPDGVAEPLPDVGGFLALLGPGGSSRGGGSATVSSLMPIPPILCRQRWPDYRERSRSDFLPRVIVVRSGRTGWRFRAVDAIRPGEGSFRHPPPSNLYLLAGGHRLLYLL